MGDLDGEFDLGDMDLGDDLDLDNDLLGKLFHIYVKSFTVRSLPQFIRLAYQWYHTMEVYKQPVVKTKMRMENRH